MVAGALAPAAEARHASMPGPTSFSVGLVDDPTFLDPSESDRARGLWFARAHGIAAGWVRLGVYWQFIAPHPSCTRHESRRPRLLLGGDRCRRPGRCRPRRETGPPARLPAGVGAGAPSTEGCRSEYVAPERDAVRAVCPGRSDPLLRPVSRPAAPAPPTAESHDVPDLERAKPAHQPLAAVDPRSAGSSRRRRARGSTALCSMPATRTSRRSSGTRRCSRPDLGPTAIRRASTACARSRSCESCCV